MSPLDKKLRATRFESVTSPHGKACAMSLRELASRHETVKRDAKDELPLIKLGRFAENYRSNDSLIYVTGVETDYDGKRHPGVTLKDAATKLRKAGLACLIVETPSSTAAAPRWRVFFPCSADAGPEHRADLVARANGVLDGILEGESFTPGQIYFYGCAGKARKVELIDGDYIDERDDLDAGAIGKSEARDTKADGVDRSKVLQAIAIDVVKLGGSFDDFNEKWPENEHARGHVMKHKSNALQRRAVERAWRWASSQVDPLIEDVEEKERKAPPQVKLYPYTDPNAADIPPREFLYGPAYIRGFVSALVAPGGAAKTSLTITEALSMASARDLLNIDADGQPASLGRALNVCLWNLEDDIEEMERRIKGAQIHFADALGGAEIKAHLYVNAATETLKIGQAVKGVAELNMPLIKGLTKALRDADVDVLIVDPFISSHGVPESDNDAVDVIVKEGWARIARDAQCSVTLVHHVRKGPAGSVREVSIEDARGASALINACRFGRVINRMSKEDAPALGVPGDSAWAYLRIDAGKANLAPPGAATWRRLRTVELRNGSFEKDDGDRIGVVEAWTPPDLSKTTSGERERIVDAIGGRAWRENVRAGEAWVGAAFARALGLDLDDPLQKAEVAVKIKAAIKAGWLVRVSQRIDGKDRPMVRVKERRRRSIEDLLGI